ncbi:peptidylprolyl isomerase [Velocimicrobium porci]|uniref:peptidylprolyl isomerase n=1 Tax=Velocimicrobium porci TaxID=2606634 RepID=A0A6L5Y0J4_9FIRM|nr:peptidylprolyl isomerase [Velocimicrobium porci]MSS63938.1 hypothetical protein [Velocimicrobium porci]
MKNWKKKLVLFGCTLGLMAMVVSGCESESNTKKIDKKELEEESKEVLMSVGEESVSYEETFAYIYMLKKQYEPSMSGNIWDFQIEEGQTFGDYAKEQVIKEITQLKVIAQEANKQQIALDDDEKEEAKLNAIEFMKNVTDKEKEVYLLSEKTMTSIMEEHLLAQKMYDIATNEVDTTISDEEAKQITIQYLMVMTKGTDKNGNKVEMNQEERNAAKKKAKSLYKQAKDASSFYALAESNTDADSVDLTFGKNNMPADFGEQAFQLKKGQLSNLIQGENGFYILYCVDDNDEDATTAKKEEIIQKNQDKLFRKKYKKWSKQYEVTIGTKLWDKIQLGN